MEMQNNTKMLPFAVGACLTAAIAGVSMPAIPGVRGGTVLSGIATGTAATDTVDISVTDEPFDGKYAIAYPVAHSISVSNQGAPCWIRARSTLAEGGRCWADTSRDWITCSDGWSYLPTILSEEESVRYEEWIQARARSADGTVTEMVEIQAVQAYGFEPDFSSADPWHGIEPQICLRTRVGGYAE